MILEILGAVKGQRKNSHGKESINEAYTIETRSFKNIDVNKYICNVFYLVSCTSNMEEKSDTSKTFKVGFRVFLLVCVCFFLLPCVVFTLASVAMVIAGGIWSVLILVGTPGPFGSDCRKNIIEQAITYSIKHTIKDQQLQNTHKESENIHFQVKGCSVFI